MKPVALYTDGACRGNPGLGGWGALLIYNGTERELFGGELTTTNNRMELLAVISGLEALTRGVDVVIITDSKYVLQGVTEWMSKWQRNGWRTAARKPVKNVDLWQRLESALARHQVDWEWVKGHAGHPENERADCLANRGIDEMAAKR